MEVSRDSALPVGDSAEAPPLRRLGFVPRWLGRWLFRQARIDGGAVEYLRELSQGGTLVYVMRDRSVVEFLLVAHVLVREGLPLPEFVSGLPTLLLRPLSEVIGILWRRLRSGQSLRSAFNPVTEAARCRRLVADGKPVLIFMRTRAPGLQLYRGAADALDRVRTGSEYLRELVIENWSAGEPGVALVPLAVVRGRGFRRKASRFATLLYSVREAPNELRRLVSLFWNAGEISIVIGKQIKLPTFIDRYRDEGAERITRRLSRALRIFLHREERLIAGPTLLPKRQVRELVLQGSELAAVIAELARREGKPEAALRARAVKYFNEMAADYHGSYFALLAFAFNRIWRRIFGGFEHIGLERVVERARRHPIVLVPCHRSHFDYLILSYLFHQEYLSPPHIAAGINLSFWPLGPLFRGAGAYFIRRSFGDNELYKVVFRNYLKFLIREGYTQEFFIEGGRSRTGKMLSAKLGMLGALVSAYVSGARRDLYFVPVSIHYGRVVEEHAYERELQGGAKEKESFGALLKARALLRQFYGSVYVSFGEPISLKQALGDDLERFRTASTGAAAGDSEPLAAIEQEQRDFVAALGVRILRDVNRVTVAGATSISATVLLGSAHAALRYDQFLPRALALAHYLAVRETLMTASLREAVANRDFRKSCDFLATGGLLTRVGGSDEVLHVPPNKRLILDFYKNTTLHFFLIPALVVRAALAGLGREQLQAEVDFWLKLYHLEFPASPERDLTVEIDAVLAYLDSVGARLLDRSELVREHPFVLAVGGVLDNFRETYQLVARALQAIPEGGLGEKRWRDQLRQEMQAALLLGETRKPESDSLPAIENALRQFAAMELVAISEAAGGRGKRGRERQLRPGPRAAELAGLIERLG